MKNFANKTVQMNRAMNNIELSRRAEYLRDYAAASLADRFLDIKRSFKKVLDLGSASGNIYKYYKDFDTLTMLHPSHVQLTRDLDLINREQLKIKTVVGSLESLPFEEESFDAVVSNLSLHWTNDLVGTMVQVRRSLKPDGLFLGTVLSHDR